MAQERGRLRVAQLPRGPNFYPNCICTIIRNFEISNMLKNLMGTYLMNDVASFRLVLRQAGPVYWMINLLTVL